MASGPHRVRLFMFLRNGYTADIFVYFWTNQIARLNFAETGGLVVRPGFVLFVYMRRAAPTWLFSASLALKSFGRFFPIFSRVVLSFFVTAIISDLFLLEGAQ